MSEPRNCVVCGQRPEAISHLCQHCADGLYESLTAPRPYDDGLGVRCPECRATFHDPFTCEEWKRKTLEQGIVVEVLTWAARRTKHMPSSLRLPEGFDTLSPEAMRAFVAWMNEDTSQTRRQLEVIAEER